jgi:hypothetical protein
MFSINKCRHTTRLLSLGNNLQGDSCLTGRFRPEDFNHAATGNATYTQCRIERDRSGGDYGNRHNRLFAAEAHN